MRYKVEKVAVLGAGTMGAQIAAHLANAGVEVLMLDMAPTSLTREEEAQGLSLDHPRVKNRIVRAGLEAAKKIKPAAFFVPANASLITTGNFADDLGKVAGVDWIIEAVVEKLEVKRDLFAAIEKHRKPGTIVSTNTSGIPIRAMAEGISEDFRRHFLGTHFFNPPRYLKLLEVIPGADTLPEVVHFIADFCDRRLGKGIVFAKDTPNFIANRIAAFSSLNTMRVMVEGGYTVEEVDAMTGPLVGRPKSASFRTADIVGLDTSLYVAENLYRAVPNDERRDVLMPPDFLREMIKRGWTGNKAGQGFYKKQRGEGGKTEYWALDYKEMEYKPPQKVQFPSIAAAKGIEDTAERIRALIYGKDRVGEFLWQTISQNLIYAANRIPEIADDIVNIDNAVKWGFNHEFGIFELWDVIGVEKSVARMREEGQQIPALVEQLLASGKKGFYERREGRAFYFDLATGDYKEMQPRPGVTILKSLKEQGRVIKKNASASLIDLGDGVACLEFHSKMNAIGGDTVAMMNYAVKEVGQNFEALVVGNQAENFSVGANIMLLLLGIQEGEWDEIAMSVRQFQNANMALRYSPKPVVVAAQGMALGGGCEVTMHGDKARAAAETYLGLVEVGVGLIPAGGGVKELVMRAVEGAAPDEDLFPRIKKVSETIAMARVSTSAVEARELGFLRDTDPITMNRDRLIEDAKQTALAMVREGYIPPKPRADIPVLGEPALAAIKLAIHMMIRGGFISEYDGHVATKLANVITGGNLSRKTLVSEQYLLDLEREAFVSLCGERKTQERIQHMLKTGKPLRN
ncbi:MAG TPA: 3-hydroxyacyl-CoA dehydrogenase NAD-binding domain-containing protein [Blastocatellia bacterium]|nr:3-hydroxyacyl-CoA dehydrogenase NAD-binding domain-containing protein [Blastocatellia bacterium]